MIRIVSTVAAFALPVIFAGAARACEHNCSADFAVYKRALNFSCGKSRLTGAEAMDIANLAGNNQIDAGKTLAAYRETCDFEFAKGIGHEVVRHTLDFYAFRKMLQYSCQKIRVSPESAREIGELAGTHAIDVKLFFKTYHDTCDFQLSKQTAGAAKVSSLVHDPQEHEDDSDSKQSDGDLKGVDHVPPVPAVIPLEKPAKSNID